MRIVSAAPLVCAIIKRAKRNNPTNAIAIATRSCGIQAPGPMLTFTRSLQQHGLKQMLITWIVQSLVPPDVMFGWQTIFQTENFQSKILKSNLLPSVFHKSITHPSGFATLLFQHFYP
jgi:hypothetical protein